MRPPRPGTTATHTRAGEAGYPSAPPRSGASPRRSGAARPGAAPAHSGITLRIVPNARKTEVVGMHGEAIKLKVASPALEGKANAEVLDFIAKAAGVAGRAVELVSGAKCRDKVVRVEGVSAEALKGKLLGARIGDESFQE